MIKRLVLAAYSARLMLEKIPRSISLLSWWIPLKLTSGDTLFKDMLPVPGPLPTFQGSRLPRYLTNFPKSLVLLTNPLIDFITNQLLVCSLTYSAIYFAMETRFYSVVGHSLFYLPYAKCARDIRLFTFLSHLHGNHLY